MLQVDSLTVEVRNLPSLEALVVRPYMGELVATVTLCFSNGELETHQIVLDESSLEDLHNLVNGLRSEPANKEDVNPFRSNDPWEDVPYWRNM